jgi:Phage tail tube protein
MGLKLGLDGKLYRNTGTFASPTWDLITNVKDVTLNLETGEADVSTRGNNGWRATVGTLKDASIEFDLIWDTSDADFTAVKDAFFNGTTIEFAVMDGLITGAGSTGSQGLRATCRINNFSRNEALEEAITVSVTAKPTYSTNPPQWMVVP